MMRNYSKKLLMLIVLPFALLLTGCNSEMAFTESVVSLARIEISASTITTQGARQLSLAAGNKQPFEAMGFYSDGSSAPLSDLSLSDWHSSDQNVGFFSAPGILTGGSTPDLVTVHVEKNGISSNQVTVMVTAAEIIALALTPDSVNLREGNTETLTVTATYSDNTSVNVAKQVEWVIADSSIASVQNGDDTLLALAAGSTTLSASKDGIFSNEISVSVTAAPMMLSELKITPEHVNILRGKTWQLSVEGIYSDGTTRDMSDVVTWGLHDSAIASVSEAGVLSGLQNGSTIVTASSDDGLVSNEVPVTICVNLAGACIDTFDTGTGKLYTSSPSKLFIDSLGIIISDEGSALYETYDGPIGEFYGLNLKNAMALCESYNDKALAGRTNWRLPSFDEIMTEASPVIQARPREIFDAWPLYDFGAYWTSTPSYDFMQPDDGSYISYYVVDLYFDSEIHTPDYNNQVFTSCTSSLEN